MKALYIKGTDDSPDVILDKDQESFMLSGKSLPENVTIFYDPILEWISEYAKEPLEKTIFTINLEYFNTASSKLILDIFMLLEEMSEAGSDVEINWNYADYDEDMKEAGVEYSEMVELKFNLILKNLDSKK